jgi:hypothetical protein
MTTMPRRDGIGVQSLLDAQTLLPNILFQLEIYFYFSSFVAAVLENY